MRRWHTPVGPSLTNPVPPGGPGLTPPVAMSVSNGHVTLDRAVVERLLAAYDARVLHSCAHGEDEPVAAALRDALRGTDPTCGFRDPHDAHQWTGGDCPGRDGLRGAEPEWTGNDDDLPGMWSHGDFLGGDPDERSYAQRERDAQPDPMPEPPSGSVIVTIDGRDVRYGHTSGGRRCEIAGPHWFRHETRITCVTWQQVLDARDPGTEVRRG